MGEAKRRKLLDPNYGKTEWILKEILNKERIKDFIEEFKSNNRWQGFPYSDQNLIGHSETAYVFEKRECLVVLFPCFIDYGSKQQFNSVATFIGESINKSSALKEHKELNRLLFNQDILSAPLYSDPKVHILVAGHKK